MCLVAYLYVFSIAVGMALPLTFTTVELLAFINAYSRNKAGLDAGQLLCHEAWDTRKKRVKKFHACCSRSHRGKRKPTKHKRREKVRSHKCECKFSVSFSQKAKFENTLRRGNNY